jgi:hypothetical protein
MQLMKDGGAIYTNGQTSASHSFETGLTVTGNVIHDVIGPYYAIYTDNGTDWITVTGNAVWNPWQGQPWGFCHENFYPGEGGGLDYANVRGNYWQGSPALYARPDDSHCFVDLNTTITGPADVPKAILDAAGLEPAFADLLEWTQAPLPPAP